MCQKENENITFAKVAREGKRGRMGGGGKRSPLFFLGLTTAAARYRLVGKTSSPMDSGSKTYEGA
jgi:hypothetical protein